MILDHILDVTGLACPIGLFKALEIHATDKGLNQRYG